MTTLDATDVSTAGATLQGSYAGASGEVIETGFYWGTSASESSLVHEVYASSGSGAAGSFSADVASLAASTTYYYRAYVVEYNASTGNYDYRYGAVKSFTTEAAAVSASKPYLGCYEVPALAMTGASASGAERYGSTKWHSMEVSSSQRVITHTYKSSAGKVVRNYTCLVDGNRQAPLWSAFVMHNGAYPRNSVGRHGSWNEDPGIPSSWQQTGVSGYSKGHLVASNYRQDVNDANDETFYYTNQAPQWQDGFNGGVWESLEQAVVAAAPSSSSDSLYVVVGVLYENSKTSDGVPVPSHFYKLLMKCSFNASGTMTAARGAAYLFTNESHTGASYSSFSTTIDAIEKRTGYDFFPRVPSSLQTAAENGSSVLTL